MKSDVAKVNYTGCLISHHYKDLVDVISFERKTCRCIGIDCA